MNLKNYSLTVKSSREKKPLLNKFIDLLIPRFVIKKIII